METGIFHVDMFGFAEVKFDKKAEKVMAAEKGKPIKTYKKNLKNAKNRYTFTNRREFLSGLFFVQKNSSLMKKFSILSITNKTGGKNYDARKLFY